VASNFAPPVTFEAPCMVLKQSNSSEI